MLHTYTLKFSKAVYLQLTLHRPTFWSHEECENHPDRRDGSERGMLPYGYEFRPLLPGEY